MSGEPAGARPLHSHHRPSPCIASYKSFKQLFVTLSPASTRARLLAAAGELFAERGFARTTARDIAQRAGVNLAAANYHFGSKRDLYLAVLRAQFADVARTLRERGGSRPRAELDRLGPEELRALLRRRITVMLEILVGPNPSLHGALMQREMTDPSDALPVIVEEFVRPMTEEMEAIVSRLAPDLPPEDLRRCVLSIVGQSVFYRLAMPIVLSVLGEKSFPEGFAPSLAEHVTEFSLGGIERAANRRAPRRKRRA